MYLLIFRESQRESHFGIHLVQQSANRDQYRRPTHPAALICNFERIGEAEQPCDILRSKPVLVLKSEMRFRKSLQPVDLLDAGRAAQCSRVSQQTCVQLTQQLPLRLECRYIFWDSHFAATSFGNEKSGGRIFRTTSAGLWILMFREFQCAICIIFFLIFMHSSN